MMVYMLAGTVNRKLKTREYKTLNGAIKGMNKMLKNELCISVGIASIGSDGMFKNVIVQIRENKGE